MKLKNKLFSVAAAGLLVFSNVTTAVVSANELVPVTEENHKAIYSSQPSEYSYSSQPKTSDTKTTRNSQTTNTSGSTTETDKTKPLTTGSIVSVTNNTKSKDVVVINGKDIAANTTITAKDSSGKKLGSVKITGFGEFKLNLKLPTNDDGGKIVLVAKEGKKDESEGLEVEFNAAAKSSTVATATGSLTMVNNSKSKDVITLENQELKVGDIISVYESADAAKPLAKITVKAPKGSKLAKGATVSTAEITLKFEGKDKNLRKELFISRTEYDKLEGARVEINPPEIETSQEIYDDQAHFVQNDNEKKSSKAKGSLFVYDLKPEDEIFVYTSSDSTAKANLIGKAKVAKGESQAYIKLKKLANDTETIYVRRATKDMEQSAAVAITKDSGIEIEDNSSATTSPSTASVK